jgi:YD repeat-containing protein
LNRLILVKDAYDHTVMKYTYDLNSRQITATNALNQTTSYQYDKNNRLLVTTDAA